MRWCDEDIYRKIVETPEGYEALNPQGEVIDYFFSHNYYPSASLPRVTVNKKYRVVEDRYLYNQEGRLLVPITQVKEAILHDERAFFLHQKGGLYEYTRKGIKRLM